jgi:hypothetical protein
MIETIAETEIAQNEVQEFVVVVHFAKLMNAF